VKKQHVCVVMPVYNCAQFLEQAIDSILRQNVACQLLCVDDGSTDGSYEILLSYGKKIHLLTHPDRKNAGSAASMNLALKNLPPSCRYIAFCDSDDLWYPEHLQRILEHFHSFEHHKLVYVNGYVVDEMNQKQYKILIHHAEENKPSTLLLNNYIRTPSMVAIRREVVDSVGYFAEYLPNSKDHDYWLRVVERFAIGFIDEDLTGYRMRANQLSSTRQLWDEGFVIVNQAMQRYGYGQRLKRKRYAVLHIRLAQFHLRHKSYLRAFVHMLQTVWYDPRRSSAQLFILVFRQKRKHAIGPAGLIRAKKRIFSGNTH